MKKDIEKVIKKTPTNSCEAFKQLRELINIMEEREITAIQGFPFSQIEEDLEIGKALEDIFECLIINKKLMIGKIPFLHDHSIYYVCLQPTREYGDTIGITEEQYKTIEKWAKGKTWNIK